MLGNPCSSEPPGTHKPRQRRSWQYRTRLWMGRSSADTDFRWGRHGSDQQGQTDRDGSNLEKRRNRNHSILARRDQPEYGDNFRRRATNNRRLHGPLGPWPRCENAFSISLKPWRQIGMEHSAPHRGLTPYRHGSPHLAQEAVPADEVAGAKMAHH